MAGMRGGGTRGGVGRIAGMAIGLGVVLALALAGEARAGTYDVIQCGWSVGTELDPSVPRTEGIGAEVRPGYCTSPPAGTAPGVMFYAWMASDGEAVLGRARWAAPPGTSITAARFTWSGELMDGFWQTAGIDDGAEYVGSVFLRQSSAPHQVTVSASRPARAFEVRLECLYLGPGGCDRTSFFSQTSTRDLILTVDDPVPPTAKLGGALVAPGWHRGKMAVELGAEDAVGAGVAREEADVDGAPVFAGPIACAAATIEGALRATKLRPCPTTTSQAFEVDTARLADGSHALRGCAVDFSGGQGCAPAAAILVDNSPPEVEFAAASEGQIAASVDDAYSGPAAGALSIRRADSGAWIDLPTALERGSTGSATLRAQLPELSAGAYFFRATATDAAGNSGSAQFRAAGSAADLRRQVASATESSGPAPRGGRGGTQAGGRATHLTAGLVGATDGTSLTVDYGSSVMVRGRLTEARGAGVAGRRVVVLARSTARDGGAPERRPVVTDGSGRFSFRLLPGTSRRVRVVFRGGDGLVPSRSRPLALRVAAAVSLTAVPRALATGESVLLAGRVRSAPARIPARGKLVTIQYLERASGRWRPALVVRTGARGRFKARYRFRYITGSARIRLRATALPEAGWPYAAGSSPPVTLEVHG